MRGRRCTLRDLGVRLAMDDYGTGYSSLAYIKDLALDEIKIDRAFVTAIDANSQNAAIVRSTIELGHSLGMMVIAEGVETEEELRHLQAFGCDYAQGYGISRPMPAEDIPRWMAARQRRTTWRRVALLADALVNAERAGRGQLGAGLLALPVAVLCRRLAIKR